MAVYRWRDERDRKEKIFCEKLNPNIVCLIHICYFRN